MEEEVSESQPAETSQAASGEGIKEKIIGVLRTIYDPEIPVDIYELGLVYDIDVKSSGVAEVKMTLTSPMCPVAESLPPEVESKIGKVPGVTKASVEVVWGSTLDHGDDVGGGQTPAWNALKVPGSRFQDSSSQVPGIPAPLQ